MKIKPIAKLIFGLILLVNLSGCGLGAAAIISLIGSGVVVAKDVVGLDMSLKQNDVTKTQIVPVVVP